MGQSIGRVDGKANLTWGTRSRVQSLDLWPSLIVFTCGLTWLVWNCCNCLGESLWVCPDSSERVNYLNLFLEGKGFGPVEMVGQMLSVSELLILLSRWGLKTSKHLIYVTLLVQERCKSKLSNLVCLFQQITNMAKFTVFKPKPKSWISWPTMQNWMSN